MLSLTDFGAYTSEPVVATSTENPIVILPGFCNSSVDYEAPFGVQRGSLASHLRVSTQQCSCAARACFAKPFATSCTFYDAAPPYRIGGSRPGLCL